MSLVESKSLLAKLLAEENLTVQHRKTPTAYFDVKNRTLVCPILKEMSPELYDLLMGHEVGHALFTPPEGWHQAVSVNDKPGFKSFLNIVEDARIERYIKDKFPGIRPSFYRGYKDLINRDFFGINHLDVNTLPLIDRINLHFKGGAMSGVVFDDIEQQYVEMVDTTETWDDVVRVAGILYQYAKTEESKTNQDHEHEDEQEDDEYGNFDSNEFDDEWDNIADEGEDDFEGQFEVKSEKAPEAITDKNFRQRERELVDSDSANNVYAELVEFDMTNRIIPHKVVHANIAASSNLINTSLPQYFNVSLRKFLEKNERYVNYMVKEFELRKNAKQFARASVNKTGELNMQKISQYKLTEDLFKRVTIVPQGKNHGLLMFLDLSGSMKSNMPGTIEQLLIVTMFCRKVNIPFEVYGFSDYNHEYYPRGDSRNKTLPLCDRNNIGSLCFAEQPFKLKQYLVSNMSRTEYNNAALNLLMMAEDSMRRSRVFSSEYLNGTPLNEAIVASIKIANDFRKKYRLEVLTNIFLTDGQSNDYIEGVVSEGESYKSFRYGMGFSDFNIVLTHKESKSVVKIPGDTKFITKGLLQIAKRATGANMVGFFISGEQPYKTEVKKVMNDYAVNIPPDFDKLVSEARKNKFYPISGTGYDLYFVVPSGKEMVIKDHGIDVDKGANKNDIRKAFMKSVQNKATNRVFLSRFCNTLTQNL